MAGRLAKIIVPKQTRSARDEWLGVGVLKQMCAFRQRPGGLLGFPRHGSSHGCDQKTVTVRGDHRKGQEATEGHKSLDRLASVVVWRDPV